MATIHELNDSRRMLITRDSAESPWRYMVREADTEEAAYTLAVATSPETWTPSGVGTMLRDRIEVEHLGAKNYYIVVNYSSTRREDNAAGAAAPPPTIDPETGLPDEGTANTPDGFDPTSAVPVKWSASISAGTQHITQAIETISVSVPAGKVAPDRKGVINVSAEGVGGVDIYSPEVRFTISERIPQMTFGRLKQLAFLACKVNFGNWGPFFAREVLYVGSEFPEGDAGNARQVTHNFAYSETRKNIVINDITVPLKRGWDYLWVEYEQATDSGSNTQFQKPLAAHVVRVYNQIDFENELGVSPIG
jgi:hypothetical protein